MTATAAGNLTIEDELLLEWESLLGGTTSTSAVQDGIAALSADDATRVFTTVVFEVGSRLPYQTYYLAGIAAEAFFRRNDLTPTHVRQVAETYLKFTTETVRPANQLIIHPTIETGFLSLIKTGHTYDISTLGSLCRLLERDSSLSRSDLLTGIPLALFQNPRCPIEVVARLRTLPPQTRVKEGVPEPLYWKDNFIREAVTTYPELAGLPETFLLQSIATQPVPDGWFLEAWNVNPSRPGGAPYDLAEPYHLSWAEVMEPR